MAGVTEAQASVMRSRRSCNVGGGVAYTCPFMCPYMKKYNGVNAFIASLVIFSAIVTHDLKIHENNSLTSVKDPDHSKILEVNFTSSPSAGRKRNNSSSSTFSSVSDNAAPSAPIHNENASFIKLLESLRIIVNTQTVPRKSSTVHKPHLPISLQQDANSILDHLGTKAKHLQSNNKQTNPPPKSRSIGQQTETALSTSSKSPASQQIILLCRENPQIHPPHIQKSPRNIKQAKKPQPCFYIQ
ncbi:hypothetical protein AVEN_90511-1 [Araneus ventricosus]|uniref:Uncharacterized protein n=1 Tax=Araneus ventricosus TaxID=182803 RepID=A0A4Y2RUQ0_ARAVE|nr:hypothetical protein AVEN_90511-1 [Araneus ventricosus]